MDIKDVFNRTRRLNDYYKTKESYTNICRLIETKSQIAHKSPRNPRESMLINHTKKSLQIWIRQKDRLKEKLLEYESLIKKDIEQSHVEQN